MRFVVAHSERGADSSRSASNRPVPIRRGVTSNCGVSQLKEKPNPTTNHKVVGGKGKIGRVNESESSLRLRYSKLSEVAMYDINGQKSEESQVFSRSISKYEVFFFWI